MTGEEQAKAKAKKAEIENAERKFQELVAKRDEFNHLAQIARDERNALNGRKRDLLDVVQKLKIERDEQVRLLREHKRVRNQLQDQARALLKTKRAKTGKVYSDLPSEAAARKAEIQYLDMKQQTQVLSLAEEEELIDDIKKKAHELRRLEAELREQAGIKVEIGEMDATLTDLFKKADEQHALVMKHYDEAQRLHERMMKLIEECSALHNEADRKHALFLEHREKADAYHLKATEMRERLLTMKNEKRMQEREARQIIQRQNKAAREALLNPEKMEKKREEALELLMKKGKITL
ncbi:MAG: hypothetical protein FJ149_05265 [Euryarchaeota archaeon]|nr:hypothetical protein [Euryarchaeota archaeon]